MIQNCTNLVLYETQVYINNINTIVHKNVVSAVPPPSASNHLFQYAFILLDKINERMWYSDI